MIMARYNVNMDNMTKKKSTIRRRTSGAPARTEHPAHRGSRPAFPLIVETMEDLGATAGSSWRIEDRDDDQRREDERSLKAWLQAQAKLLNELDQLQRTQSPMRSKYHEYMLTLLRG